jgi:hypothetical protein
LMNELKSENIALKVWKIIIWAIFKLVICFCQATVQVLQTEFAEKVKQYENEIAELKVFRWGKTPQINKFQF